jgi:hypothetical protein
MHMRKTAAALVLALAAGSAAHASNILTVTATYDPLITANTSFTIDNTSGVAETNIDLVSGSYNVMVGDLAAGASETYVFNEANGPFTDEPGDKGVPDTTAYQVSFNYLGSAASTADFSPVSNLTGGYVDFLGGCYLFREGCSVDPTANYPLTGEVAQAVAPVPLPPALLLMLSGLAGVAPRVFGRGKKS